MSQSCELTPPVVERTLAVVFADALLHGPAPQVAWPTAGRAATVGLEIGTVETNLHVQPTMTGQRLSTCLPGNVPAIADLGALRLSSADGPTPVMCIGRDSCHPDVIKDFPYLGHAMRSAKLSVSGGGKKA